MIDPSADRAVFRQLADLLRDQIQSGELAPGEPLPSELRLAQEYGISRTTVRQAMLGVYDRRVMRGEGNPLPSWQAGVYASTELPSLWQLPSIDLTAVPLARGAVPRVPAAPAIAL